MKKVLRKLNSETEKNVEHLDREVVYLPPPGISDGLFANSRMARKPTRFITPRKTKTEIDGPHSRRREESRS